MKRPGVGVGLMMLRDGKILLGKRHTDPEKADSELHGEGTWTMPGGKIDFGESPEQAVVRELQEETGMDANPEKLKLVSVSNDAVDDAHFITLGFLCEDCEGEPSVLEPDEITEWRWFALDALPERVFFPSANVLQNYLAGRIYKQ
ncbi:NUDIX domain-containing protein [Candidatus Woesearchaeota archaeon]|nr:NUDIX domain-containing protein [Candidatus Woesearchaeota archaeon]